MAKKFILKLLLLITLIGVLQHLYYQVLGSAIPSIQKTSRMNYRFHDESKGEYDLALLASSINFTTAKTDKDKRDIAEMMEDNLEKCRVLDVSRGGNNIELYDEITKSILKYKKTPVKLVYEISIRTFAPAFNEPANVRSLKDDEVIFDDNILTSFYHALNVFRYNFGGQSEKEYHKQTVFRGLEDLGPLDDFMEETHPSDLSVAQKKFLIYYMGRIKENNTKYQALKKLVQLIKKNSLDVLFVIPPENYRQGQKYFPSEFDMEFDNNIKMVTTYLDSAGLEYLNLSKALGSPRFTHPPRFPNGHLDQKGRQFIANKITEKIGCVSSN